MSAASRWLAELKRRKVFRVAAVYGATAFVALQGADLILPRLGLPAWTVTLAVVLALLGLPVALGLAWAFDSTPDGVRRTGPADAAEIAAIAALPRSRRWTTGMGGLAGIVLLAGGAWWTLAGAGARPPVYDSIAVLPFANLSGDPQDDYFGDGLAEELLNALSGIEGLKVAARTSTFALRGGNIDVRTIGDTLRVATVLEGSVRRSEDRVRIAAQLIDARTGYRLWAETYDRPRTELFAVQDAIAAEIMDALAVRLKGGAGGDGLFRGGTTDVEAYDLYLLGRQKWVTRDMSLLREAVEHFEHAIARDSGFALAWSGFADAINALAWRRDDIALSRLDEAKYAAQRAIFIDPALAEGWASVGVLASEFDRDWAVGELALRRAVQLKPSYAPAEHWLADLLAYSGRPEEALVHRFRTRELDPISPFHGQAHAWGLVVARRWDEARAEYRRLSPWSISNSETLLLAVTQAAHIGLHPAEAAAYAEAWATRVGLPRPSEATLLASAALEPRRRADALALLRRMEAEGGPAWDLAALFATFGDSERALRLLQRAYDEGDPQLVMTAVDPTFDPLRGDPRFIRILQALRLPTDHP